MPESYSAQWIDNPLEEGHYVQLTLQDDIETDVWELTPEDAYGLRNALSAALAQQGPSDHHPDEKLRIYINRAIKDKASPNKIAAHAVHAALTAFGVHPHTKVVVLDKGPTAMEQMRTVIHDAGHTELEPGTLTASTNWPEDTQP